MNSGGKEATVYVDIDALLDVRLGVMARINPDVASKLAVSKAYQDRVADIFDGVPEEVFRDAYLKRTTEDLANSVMTNCVPFLATMVKDLYYKAKVGPHYDSVNVVLNTAPYELEPDVSDELGKAVAHWMHGLADVSVVSIPMEELTPQHCKDHYYVMVKYEFDNWMSCHTASFETVRLYDILLYAPALYSVIPTEEEEKEAIKHFKSAFIATEKLAAPLIGLHLLPAETFSIVN